ncbi:O-acetylserine/cysteine efflux transporter [Dongia mobilis]|uniref:O-acetylserine/cysteine efflux transporter n=1 Tax=Dongia mobilis TaxID=578943 RepID=A0A4R6WGY0_9PROT|nr:EamA family transporter [Dongia mobilis]TDQ77690.1 O-acetylserine/cysteine efflux transporter [Dongia mobilis]
MKPIHIALALLVAALWGANFVAIKIGLGAFPPFLLSALRFLAVMLPMIFFVGRPCVGWGWILSIGIVFGIVKFGLLFLGMDWGMPAGLSSLVLQAQAPFTVLFAVLLLKERLSRVQVAGMVLAALGLVLIGIERAQATSLAGLLLVIAAAAAWGYANILMKQARAPNMLNLVVWVAVVVPVPMILLSLVFEGGERILATLAGMDGRGVLAVLYIAWASTIVGFSLWVYLLRHYSASMVAPFSLMVPVFGIATAALVLGEALSGLEIAAGILTLIGLLLVVRGAKQKVEVAA